MNVVDSSAWLEYLADGPNAAFFAHAVEDGAKLIVPSIRILEVFKRVFQQRGEGDALKAVALMHQGEVVSLDGPLALSAAKVSLDLKLPLADSVVLATPPRTRSCGVDAGRRLQGPGRREIHREEIGHRTTPSS